MKFIITGLISSIVMLLIAFPSSVKADFCVKNKASYEVGIDIKCGIDTVKRPSDFKRVKSNGKVCKKNKVWFVPVPCIASIGYASRSYLTPSNNSSSFSDSMIQNLVIGVSNGRLGKHSGYCKIGPAYKSKTIGNNFFDNMEDNKDTFGFCVYK